MKLLWRKHKVKQSIKAYDEDEPVVIAKPVVIARPVVIRSKLLSFCHIPDENTVVWKSKKRI